MKRMAILLCMSIVLMTAAAPAQQRSDPAAASGAWSYESRESDARFYISGNGIFGYDAEHNGPGLIVPRGSISSYLFGAGLWMGARKRVDGDMRKLVFVGYNPNSGVGWGAMGPYGDEELDLSFYTSLNYNPDGTWKPFTAPATQSWPLWVLPGTITTPLHSGAYESAESERRSGNGRYVAAAFMPGVDEQIVNRFNDKGLESYEIIDRAELAGYPLGLDIRESVYGWREGLYRNAVVLQYEVINRSSDTLYDCVIAQASDPDVGESANDHLSYDERHPELRMAYAWTDPEPGDELQTLLISILEAPQADASGRVDNSDRLGYYMNGRIGSSPRWTDTADPKTSAERYNFMTSGVLAADAGPADQRSLLASRTFTMLPGDTAHFAVLYLVAPYVRGTSVPTAAEIVAAIMRDYYGENGFNSTASVGDDRSSNDAATIAPNPARTTATVGFTLDAPARVTLRLVNALGEMVMERDQGALAEGAHTIGVDLKEIPTGTYFLIVSGMNATKPLRLTIVR